MKKDFNIIVSVFHGSVIMPALLVITLFSFVSCRQEKEKTISTSKSYFDLESLVTKDINNNKQNGCGETKTVLVNGIKETKNIDKLDWQKELQPIIECDINKPAWNGKFLVDTIQGSSPEKYSVLYRPSSGKINVKLLQATYINNRLDNIYLIKQIHSFIFSSNQTIEYFPERGFTVRGTQKAAMMENFELNVDVKYSCK